MRWPHKFRANDILDGIDFLRHNPEVIYIAARTVAAHMVKDKAVRDRANLLHPHIAMDRQVFAANKNLPVSGTCLAPTVNMARACKQRVWLQHFIANNRWWSKISYSRSLFHLSPN
jgi:hypothetical protein